MNKIVIYTSLVGGYDTLPQPLVIYPDCDYLCFSNDFNEKKVGVWEIRKIPIVIKDNTRLSRFVKINPQSVLSDYQYSVWIDSNIQILDEFLHDCILTAIDNHVLWGAVNHPDKDCIYTDARNCACGGNESFWAIYNQCKFLKGEGYPEKNGLYENNLIFRNHNDKQIEDICVQWWDIYMKFSKRDQLSLCYILWKNGFKPEILLPDNINTWDKKHFNRVLHEFTFMYHVKRRLKHIINSILFNVFKF